MAPIKLSHLQIRNPKEDETTPEAATQIFSSLLSSQFSLLTRMFSYVDSYAFEIYLTGQSIFYYASVPTPRESLVQSLLQAAYPQSFIQRTQDPMDIILKDPNIAVGKLSLQHSYTLPIKTYADFSDLDPLAAMIGLLSKQGANYKFGIQILVTPASFAWQGQTLSARTKEVKDPKTGEMKTQATDQNASYMSNKVMYHGGRTTIRLIASSKQKEHDPHSLLQNVAGTYGSFSLGEGNHLGFSSIGMGRKEFMERLKNRSFSLLEHRTQIMNAQELATLWHPPGKALAGIKNIAWGKTLAGEPPENLPTVDSVPESMRHEVNFFAKAEYKNKDTIFGIKTADRRKHNYIIGKTGAGKSTLIANMAIDDIRRDRGVGIIDPHGDLSETILQYIPKRRMQDVVYLEPFDTERPFALNVLEIKQQQHRDLVASGIVAIFSKLYADSWGPRLEYILRNTIISLLELPQATLVDALRILSEKEFRKKAVLQIQDPVMKDFWNKEFDMMTDKLRVEAISPIQNKVGQFVSSKMIRNIIGQQKSTVDLEAIMNDGKILILNLSQGKLGEDNAALLGAMIITQIQLAAMNRSFIKEDDRRDFFLYVDEFQNFATSSFVKILSEARKYRLALTLTNQYIEQLDEDIMTAIFGNVGTLISFVIGARDADYFTKEFSGLYTAQDLVSLGKYEVVMKMSIDQMTSAPFPAKTLPLPAMKNENTEKIIRMSKEKYGRKLKTT
ncbi:MAG: type IV secretory system conjugative DNA transfer family protein [Weeksellaceae bacterium]